MGGIWSAYGLGEVHTGFGGEIWRKKPLQRPRHRWEDSMIMCLPEVGRGGMNWIDVAQGRDKRQADVNVVMSLWVS
jgi:hypothetical protein